MKRKKQRFEELLTFERVFQPEISSIAVKSTLKGIWASEVFKNDHPIILELGCGRGEYTIGLARRYPEKNFIGIDIKGARLWKGAKTGHEEEIKNAAFLRTKIELLGYFFDSSEIAEIWLTFPDPQPKSINENRRLGSPAFLDTYKHILMNGGCLHLKTDDPELFEYTVSKLRAYSGNFLHLSRDLYSDISLGKLDDEVLSIRTTYEQIFLNKGKPIHYLKYRF